MNQLRPYQRAAHDATFSAWARGVRRPALAHATGAGKTTTFAGVVGTWLARNRGRRALVLAHRIELVDQGAKRMSADLGIPVGVMMGSRNQTLQRVVMGSVATVGRSESRRRMLRDVGLIVVDECHHAAAASYVTTLTHYGAMGERRRDSADALGVTATMTRGDNLALGDVWEEVVHQYPIAQAIAEGWLKRPHGIAVRVENLDLRSVKTRAGGEYQDGALGEAIEGSLAPQRMVEAYREHAADRQGVVFLPTVHSATVIRDAFREAGFTCEVVHANTPPQERASIIAGVRAGRVQVLTNCGVFTEGTDLPMLSVAVIGRPTNHGGLYIQMAGRPLRLWCPVHRERAGNLLDPCCDREVRDALILDVVGASRRHTLSARVELFGAEEAREIEGVALELSGDEEIEQDETSSVDDIEEYADGALAYEMVDLFGASSMAWMRTAAGIWFIEAGDRYIAIVPGPDNWRTPDYDVISMNRYIPGEARWVAKGHVSLPEAMRHAELDVTVRERSTASRGRAWRAGGPSAIQLNLAAAYNIAVLPGATAGLVSEAITCAMATARIDPYLPAHVTFVGV